MRILVAEDEQEIRKSLVEALENEGHVVVAVQNGLDAHALLLRDSNFDRIISDNTMPMLTGVELLGLLRKDSNLGIIPFTLVSAALADQQDQLQRLARRFGATFYAKPFDTKKVFEELGLLKK